MCFSFLLSQHSELQLVILGQARSQVSSRISVPVWCSGALVLVVSCTHSTLLESGTVTLFSIDTTVKEPVCSCIQCEMIDIRCKLYWQSHCFIDQLIDFWKHWVFQLILHIKVVECNCSWKKCSCVSTLRTQKIPQILLSVHN